MPTFFVRLTVAPAQGSTQAELVEGAFACCWVLEDSAAAAINKAQFYVTKGEWEIRDDSEPPAEVTEEACRHWNIGLENFRKAQEEGIALLYWGWSRDGKTTAGPIPLPETRRFDLNDFVRRQKKLAGKGRCLHFDSDARCKEIIDAHSIQRRGPLSTIADEGHVYVRSANIGDIRKNDGRTTLKKRGIGKTSTFAGFCRTHDNEVFAPIDKQPLIPTREQVLLYAYRSLCREFFVKENALDLLSKQFANWPESHPLRHFEDLKAGTAWGLDELRRHKADFEAALRRQTFEGIEYTLFVARQQPTLAFSGLIYPHFDFLGRRLQALENLAAPLDLMTFCSATMNGGWGFLFAWHKSSAGACRPFMGSLAQAMYDGMESADALFRLVVSNCENLALGPSWWENLDEDNRAAVCERISLSVDPFMPIEPGYLTKGLEGISGWEFESVLTNVPAGASGDAA